MVKLHVEGIIGRMKVGRVFQSEKEVLRYVYGVFKKIDEHFLKKIMGTVVKDKKGKKHYVCAECQKKLKTKDLKVLQ